MKPKEKRCKGITELTKGLGCGKLTTFRKNGLCSKCYASFLYSEKGESIRTKFFAQNKKKVKKELNAQFKERKKESKKKSYFEAQLQTEVNKIARLIDADEGCISCSHGHDTPFTRQKHGGHFYAVGGHANIRFNLMNIRLQCSICNHHKGGNEREYKENLIKKFGFDYFEKNIEIMKSYGPIHLSKLDLQERIVLARQIVRNIEKGRDYTRKEVNKILDIYK